MAKVTPKVYLLFTDGPMPTKEQKAFAEKVNGLVRFRNVRMYDGKEHTLEQCDGVIGKLAPEAYVKRFGKYDANKNGKGTTTDPNAGTDLNGPTGDLGDENPNTSTTEGKVGTKTNPADSKNQNK